MNRLTEVWLVLKWRDWALKARGQDISTGRGQRRSFGEVFKEHPLHKDYKGKYKNTDTIHHLQAQASLFPVNPIHGLSLFHGIVHIEQNN